MPMREGLNGLALVLMLPAVVAHELTHAIAAKPFGDVREISIYPPKAVLEYPAGTPWLAIRAVNLSPCILGTVVGLPALWWLLTTQSLSPPVLAYLVGSWAVYTVPASHEDRNPKDHAKVA